MNSMYPKEYSETTPIVILTHGLTGNSLSYDVLTHTLLLRSKGFICCVWTRRGCDPTCESKFHNLISFQNIYKVLFYK